MARSSGPRRFQRVRLVVRRRRAHGEPRGDRAAPHHGPDQLRRQRHRIAAALDRAADRRGAPPRRQRWRRVRRRRGRARRVVVVLVGVAGVEGRRADRSRRSGGRDPCRRAPPVSTAASPTPPRHRPEPACVRRARGRRPRAEPHHHRHRSVGHPPPGAHRPAGSPARCSAAQCRPVAHRAAAQVGSRHAGRDRRRPAARRSVPRCADVEAVGGRGDDHHHPRPGRRRVLRQGRREGLPAGRRHRHRHVRRRAGRRLLAGRRHAAARDRRSASWPRRPASSVPAASRRARCRTCRSPRSASSGSACSVRSRCSSCACPPPRAARCPTAGNRGTDTLFLLALGRRRQRRRCAVRRLGGRSHPAAGVDQPEQDGRGAHRRRADDDHRPGRRRHRRVERHLGVADAPVRPRRS